MGRRPNGPSAAPFEHGVGGERRSTAADDRLRHAAGGLAAWLEDKGVAHIRDAPRRPPTQDEIERRRKAFKNRMPLESHHPPGELAAQVTAFAERHDHIRALVCLGDLTPRNVHFGRGEAFLAERNRIKRQTLAGGRLQHYGQAARPQTQMDQTLRFRDTSAFQTT